jgi:protein-L-isoaspartate(D-aspartate) O-methyltransferase
MHKLIFSIILSLAFMGCSSQPADFPQQRKAMVEKQILWRGITDPQVLQAMSTVPREEFVLPEHRSRAYNDIELPLGEDQTLDRPYEDAFILNSLQLKPNERILEIGTGSGYLTALLAQMGGEVYTIDIVPKFIDEAQAKFKKLRYDNIKSKAGDGYLGWSEYAPFDAIVLTCSPTAIPQPIQDQLAEGGRLLIPLGGQDKFQELLLFHKQDGRLTKPKSLAGATFVPMKGQAEN